MPEKRIIELESRIAFQEYQLSELNDQIADQQKQILELKSVLKTIVERITTSSGGSFSAEHSVDERPPHY
ncbi:MAG: SlyX family protein [Desulfuromonadaceae bacterium]|jgi:uncharacterized coiled-coil protein SlyX|nr:SlyX family protein [Desulfuromonas sp.]MDY0185194.1 SlyX family protein [Desulfuromonadaceae bacterium]